MSTPQKPWESNPVRQSVHNHSIPISSARYTLNSNAPPLQNPPTGSMRPVAVMLPPLPPRPAYLATPSLRPSFGMGSNMYGGYAGYPGYGGYSSYGNYPGSMYMPGGYNFGSYGNYGSGYENRLLHVAEESSRNAFQSIESLVRAFTSVSMMLESTYHAMYSSFRAVLGVVDNFSRLRLMFAQFISAITILRTIRNFYRQLLHWIGILDSNPQPENVWGSVTAGAGSLNNEVATYSSWPLITFFGLLFGGPYLISKLSSSKSKDWDPSVGTWIRAKYPHEAMSDAELGFDAQEMVNVAPSTLQSEGAAWLLAKNSQGKIGYVPVTRLGFQPIPKSSQPVRNVVTNLTNNQDVNSST